LKCRGLEARLQFDGRLREAGRASSATSYSSSAAAAGGGVEPVFLLEKRRETRKSEGALKNREPGKGSRAWLTTVPGSLFKEKPYLQGNYPER
jgi:hypothetical protein